MFLLLYSIVRIFNKQFSLKFYFKHYFFSVHHLALQFYSNRVLIDPTRGHTATADHSVQVDRLYLYNTVVQVCIRTLTFTVLCSYVQQYLVFVIFICLNTILHIALDKRRRRYFSSRPLGQQSELALGLQRGDGHRKKCLRKSSGSQQYRAHSQGELLREEEIICKILRWWNCRRGRVQSVRVEKVAVFPRETRYIRIHYTHPRGTGGVEEPADRCTAEVCAAAARSR